MVEIHKTVINPFEEAKKERLEWLIKYCKTREEIPHLQLMSLLQVRFGVSEDTARAYIRVLINSGDFENRSGVILFRPPTPTPTEDKDLKLS